jgi:hypothetical protein
MEVSLASSTPSFVTILGPSVVHGSISCDHILQCTKVRLE